MGNSEYTKKLLQIIFCRVKFFILFSSIFLFVSQEILAQSYSKLVNTQLGTEGNGLGCGFNFVGATYPFGMIQFTPSFFSPQKGFVVNQLSGAGCPHMGNFPVLPLSGELTESPNDMKGFEKYNDIIKSHAGFLSLRMPDETLAKLTVNQRAGIANFSFNKLNNKGTVLIGSWRK